MKHRSTTFVNCLSCHHPPEQCQCLKTLAKGSTPATIVKGTVESDPERSSAIWIREDPRCGAPFLTVILEPMPKATVDDVRLAAGALVRWRNATLKRIQRPFGEDDALQGILALFDQIVEQVGVGARGIHVKLAEEVNQRLMSLLRDYVHDRSLLEEAQSRILPLPGSDLCDGSSLDKAVREIVIERYLAGNHQDGRFHSLVGLVIATYYLRALGYTPNAAEQICSRAADDIALEREPFGPEYPADRRRMREVVRKGLRKRDAANAVRG